MVKTARMILDCKIGTKYYNTCTKCYLLTLITNKTWSKLVSNSLTLVPSLIYPAWFNTLIYTSPRTQILELNINSVFTSFYVHVNIGISGTVVLQIFLIHTPYSMFHIYISSKTGFTFISTILKNSHHIRISCTKFSERTVYDMS